jgi:tRNA-binding protein
MGADLVSPEEFARLDLRLAKVLSAERIEGSEKLIKLRVSLGDEERTLVAGIAHHYRPEDLVGKKILILANLKPKRIFGVESQGMVIALQEGDRVSLLVPDREVSEGAKAF